MNKHDELKDYKKHFEANLLDGDEVQEGQMISAVETWNVVQGIIDRAVLEARIDEVTNAKVVHIEIPKEANRRVFDDWCTKRQQEIRDGVPPKYEYEAPPKGFKTWQQFESVVDSAYNSQFENRNDD